MDTMNGFRRSHYCTELSIANVGQSVSVCGWVQRQRDKGALIFVDLREAPRHVPAHQTDTRQRSRATPACSSS